MELSGIGQTTEKQEYARSPDLRKNMATARLGSALIAPQAKTVAIRAFLNRSKLIALTAQATKVLCIPIPVVCRRRSKYKQVLKKGRPGEYLGLLSQGGPS